MIIGDDALKLELPAGLGLPLPTGAARTAVDTLGRMIVNGVYEPGQVMPTEPQLADLLGVGRATVRDAVKVLSGKGVVRTARHQGTRVRPVEDWNLIDVDVISWHEHTHPRLQQMFQEAKELRYILEPPAAALAAVRATPQQLESIVEAAQVLDPDKTSIPELFRADCVFHSTILEATGNLAMRQVRPLIVSMLKVSYEFKVIGESARFPRDDHMMVASAIRSGDPAAAKKAMAQMLDPKRKTTIAALGL